MGGVSRSVCGLLGMSRPEVQDFGAAPLLPHSLRTPSKYGGKFHAGCGKQCPADQFERARAMIVGTVREIKDHEYRVGLTPESVQELATHGHPVLVQAGAGSGIGADDEAYERAGAEIVDTADEVFHRAEMIVKVKEPQPSERARLREGQILYTYLHLAPDPEQTEG